MGRECIESRQREQKIVPAGERVRYTQEFAELGAQIAASRLGLKIYARFRAKSSHAAQLARKSGKLLTNCPRTSASCWPTRSGRVSPPARVGPSRLRLTGTARSGGVSHGRADSDRAARMEPVRVHPEAEAAASAQSPVCPGRRITVCGLRPPSLLFRSAACLTLLKEWSGIQFAEDLQEPGAIVVA
jgi:hypothetical protein